MEFLGSQTIETERLILKAYTMEEQKRLWEILMMPEVAKYYLIIPEDRKEDLKDWSKQEKFYQGYVEEALNKDIYRWSIFIKETGECIGKVSSQKASKEFDDIDDDESIRSVGWYIDPKHQGKGYGYEAATAMMDYLFRECEITSIVTSAAIDNPASWKLMEKFGMIRESEPIKVKYTYIKEKVPNYKYSINREQYLKKNDILTKQKKI